MQYIYLVKCEKFYKIGIANDVQNRLAQLATGNPFALEEVASFGFANASFVESAIHQRFANTKIRGEWFELNNKDIADFKRICQLLGGLPEDTSEISEQDIQDAEELSESSENGKWDYEAMFSDGWRMEAVNRSKSTSHWIWRRFSREKRESLYGGLVRTLPYPIKKMRSIYGKNKK